MNRISFPFRPSALAATLATAVALMSACGGSDDAPSATANAANGDQADAATLAQVS
jgi:hypothetical protein